VFDEHEFQGKEVVGFIMAETMLAQKFREEV
jgi:hypothetical protein